MLLQEPISAVTLSPSNVDCVDTRLHRGKWGEGVGERKGSFWRETAFASQGEPFANKRRTKELKAPLLSKMVSKSWLDLGWDRPRIKLFWVLPPGNFTGIWLQKDKLKVMQPKRKGNSWLKNYTAKTFLSPKLPNIIYDFFQHAPKELKIFFTKTVDTVFRALWLAAQSVNILHYSLIHLQFLLTSDAKLA